MNSESGVVLNRYKGTYDKEDKYSVSIDGIIKNKNMTEEAARCFATKLSGEQDYVDATKKRSVVSGKTVVTQSTEEEDKELTLLESLVEQVAGQTNLIEMLRQENADKYGHILEEIRGLAQRGKEEKESAKKEKKPEGE